MSASLGGWDTRIEDQIVDERAQEVGTSCIARLSKGHPVQKEYAATDIAHVESLGGRNSVLESSMPDNRRHAAETTVVEAVGVQKVLYATHWRTSDPWTAQKVSQSP